jgi:hypothetical protein
VLLFADPQPGVYAAYHFTDKAVPLSLRTPLGTVEAAGFGCGQIVLRREGRPTLEIWTLKREGPLFLPKSVGAQVLLNGEDVTARLQAARRDGREVWQLP